MRPVLPRHAQGEPEVGFVGSPAIQPPRIPIDAADAQHQGQFFVGGGEFFIDVFPQRPQGGLDIVEVLLLVALEPGALVVEPNAPEKILCFF